MCIRDSPNVGDFVTTADKLKGEVSSVNVLRQLVKVIVTLENDEKEIREYKVEDLRFKPKRRRDNNNINDDELKACLLYTSVLSTRGPGWTNLWCICWAARPMAE